MNLHFLHPESRRAAHILLLPTLILCALGAGVSESGPVLGRSTPWGTNGTVTAIAGSGNTVYIGGTFTIVGPSTGSSAVVSPVTGAPIGAAPRVAGIVYASTPDGAGGWYLGGSIVGIDGRPCGNLAHVSADGSVSAWSPTLDGPVLALASGSGTLYVGGDFHSVDGVSRNMGAAFNVSSGQLTGWNPQASSLIRALAVYRGSIFVGGDFVQIGGGSRAHLARLSGDTGTLDPWSCDADAAAASFATSNDTVYIGGYFSTIHGAPRSLLAAVNAETGDLLAFDPDGVPEPQSDFDTEPSRVGALAIVGGSLVVGGISLGWGDRVESV